jgi:hypothetical protein
MSRVEMRFDEGHSLVIKHGTDPILKLSMISAAQHKQLNDLTGMLLVRHVAGEKRQRSSRMRHTPWSRTQAVRLRDCGVRDRGARLAGSHPCKIARRLAGGNAGFGAASLVHAHELGRHVAASVAQTQGRSVWMPIAKDDPYGCRSTCPTSWLTCPY